MNNLVMITAVLLVIYILMHPAPAKPPKMVSHGNPPSYRALLLSNGDALEAYYYDADTTTTQIINY